MTSQTFKLPDLGEGLTESEVLNWKIKVGEHVALNQIIAEVETAKAVVELPSPFAGVVQKLHASEGQVVPVGADLVTFDDGQQGTASAERPGEEVESDPAAERTPTLVGYGAPASTGSRPARRRRAGTPVPAAEQGEQLPVVEPLQPEAVRSTPPVRKLARDHGIDLRQVSGSGRDGLVLRKDVERAIAGDEGKNLAGREASPARSAEHPADRRIKISAMRRATAKAMVESAFTAPHATEFLTVDVTRSLDLIDSLHERREFAETKLTINSLTAFVATRLLRRFPALNSRWNGEQDEIIQFGAVHLGVAVASERGLLVPVVKDAQDKSLLQLAADLNHLVALGRSGDLTPAQLGGGTFSMTNVGVFGVDSGTPILSPGQTGILALGQVKPRPWGYEGQVLLRQTAMIALSFDHRVVDGKEASEFLAGVGAVLEDPGMMNFFI